ncbi:hypothetical protein L1785_07730 [Antribacter sp. KLBMP9083]|uniref:Uncharacterized protein n=1 Tax=Antribacter soli TaxID=2910976 RepID=A0AA41QEW8_9MICO|nr:hypothetical protein [Antribacter soli]MCF4120867.1 hypothetical protein [Antribacter soli]
MPLGRARFVLAMAGGPSAGILGGVDYYARAEGGDRVEDPDHDDLIRLVGALNTSDNSFFVVYPVDEDAEWFVSVSLRAGASGDYEVARNDPRSGQQDTITAADPAIIARELTAWLESRPARF